MIEISVFKGTQRTESVSMAVAAGALAIGSKVDTMVLCEATFEEVAVEFLVVDW